MQGTREKMTVAELRRTMTEGRRFLVTNHYITAPDHPCSGMRVREVVRANTTGFYLSLPDNPRGSFVEWPKAAQVARNGDAIEIYGGGCAQDAGDLFLTLTEIGGGVDA